MKEKYIKSPLNYIGGKYKLLKDIIPLFPEKINTFVDLFGGGFNVGINVNANHVIYNDTCVQVVDLLRNFYEYESDYIHKQILRIISEYKLSRSDLYGYKYYDCNSNNGLSEYNKSKYIKLREDYNKKQDWLKFYTIIAYTFSNQIRFNSKGEFNMPCGKRDYNISLQEKLQTFVDEMHKKDVCFFNEDFRRVNFNKNCFVYCDPPYLNSVAVYNEQNGWTDKNEKELLDILDKLNTRGIKFALSNNLKYDNLFLEDWKNKYNVHFLNSNYSNCNYQKKDKSKDVEVLITNY